MRLVSAFLLAFACSAQSHWVVTWGASPAPPLADPAQMRAANLEFDNHTLREIVHTSIGGNTMRVRLSNAYGKEAVHIGGTHVALRANGSAIVAGSDRVVTFSGRTAVTIPPDALVLSDPVKLDFPASSDLAISIFLPKPAKPAGIHFSALQTSYIGKGDLTAAASMSEAATMTSWAFLSGVDVLASR
ncbi:MAG: SGNH/GDSL hydrolase family protein, partial [Bryobacteraceae bacterium]